MFRRFVFRRSCSDVGRSSASATYVPRLCASAAVRACVDSLDDFRAVELVDLEETIGLARWPVISRRRFVGAVLRAGLHAYGDYDAAGADRAKRSLTDLAVLWTTKFDPDARVCYEAAGAAGNALAADVAARLGTETPATLKKLLRKYPLDAFATKHLETLPTGLARLEAVLCAVG